MRDPYLTDAQKVRVVTELIEMTRRTIEGQALDLGWARDKRYDITPDDYLCMAIHKTAHYSGAVPLAVGAIVGGGTEEQIAALREYGLATGLAFQIQETCSISRRPRNRGQRLRERYHRRQAHTHGRACVEAFRQARSAR